MNEHYYNYMGLYPVQLDRYGVQNKGNSIHSYIVYMLDRLQQMFEYKNLPEHIPQRNLELLLMVNGYACITQANGSLYAFFGGLGGEPDAYYMPTECIVNNPALNFNKVCKIDEDCIIIKNDSMYRGLLPMFTRYAQLLAENDITCRVQSINTRIQLLLSAGDDRTAEAAKKYLEDIEEGKLGAIAEGSFFDNASLKVQQGATGTQQNYTQLIEYGQYLKASWYNELGIQANYNMKRENLNVDEVQLNLKALLPLAENMLECRKQGVEAVNEMFGTDISVDLKSVWKDTQLEVEQIDQLKGVPETEDGAGPAELKAEELQPDDPEAAAQEDPEEQEEPAEEPEEQEEEQEDPDEDDEKERKE